MNKPRIFIDSSVIIAGLISETGGSAKILRSINQDKFIALTSFLVLKEVERNIRACLITCNFGLQ